MDKREKPAIRGAGNGKWRGGVWKNDNGYLRISAGPQRGKYVHQLVAQAKLGRVLQGNESVDHRDGNKLNNAPENLDVVPRSENTRRQKRRNNADRDLAAVMQVLGG